MFGRFEMEFDYTKSISSGFQGIANQQQFNVHPSARPATKILKKKKLKINVHIPVGTRVVFDEEDNMLPPIAELANTDNTNSGNDLIQHDIGTHF
ncbi:hypothetical protein AQUCO_00100674v1 [Aquilegia coerulea]|uniref:Uncharacterized protein n=1 Tax=Aquilegia coerulea TaxID=218851 RepID=A0A2G5FBG5_AQUCA|nr:hypothetical protein AQUCO_00100674v1 [Aquilegia coerulea]